MKILISGGAGFIGRNYIIHLRQQHPEYDLLCIDKLTYGGKQEIMSSLEGMGVKLCVGDIADRDTVASVFEGFRPDAVVNFAAESHVDKSIANPALFLHSNVLGTQVLLEASLKYEVERFHQISTDEVYGTLPGNRPELLFSEASPLCPSNPYSATKASADLLCGAYVRTYGLPVTISRCSNNFGPYQFADKLIPMVISHALNNKPIPIYGTGENIRDWLFVSDHCQAISMILEGGKAGEVYNVGGSCEKRNIDVAKKILAMLGKPESLIEFAPDRKSHDLRYGIDAGYIRSNLGWKPDVDFDKGLLKTIDWYTNKHM